MNKTKNQVGELAEKIDAMGQDNEIKAAKWVKEQNKIDEAEEDEYKNKKTEVLERKSRYSFTNYKQYLADIVLDIIKNNLGVVRGWTYRSFYSDKGVGLVLLNGERKFIKAFMPNNIPKYDLNACAILCLEAENTIDKIEQDKKKTVNGLILP